MTAQDHPHSRVEFLISMFGDWLKHRRELSEMRQMDRFDFDRIASDLHISPGELDELVHHGPHAADELPKLFKALGIDEAALVRTEPLVLRDMERVCALCHSKGQCDRDLAAGNSAAHYEGYCLNAPTIHDLGLQVKQ
jgi:transcriptional regulator with XRE-family HTH domain